MEFRAAHLKEQLLQVRKLMVDAIVRRWAQLPPQLAAALPPAEWQAPFCAEPFETAGADCAAKHVQLTSDPANGRHRQTA